MQASCSIDCWMETSKRIQCKCNPEPQTFCTAHILKHFSEPGEHIISFSVEDPSSLMRIYIKFLTGIHPNNYCIPCCKKKAADDVKIYSNYQDCIWVKI